MEAANPNSKPVTLFYSYSHRDEALRDELETHLSLLRREGIIQEWHDRRIGAGKEWAEAIDENLEAANIILLLISADFLASDYCYDKEMTRALEKDEAGEARVVPVIVRSVDWNSAPFGKLQALPKNGEPVTSWPNQDEAWTDVARGIRRAIENLPEEAFIDSLVIDLEEPGKPWNVPYKRNLFFTGRDDVIEKLHSALGESRATALAQPQAIGGLGGIGKTQTAVEYAYRYRDEYEAILWARSDSREALISDYIAIANLLDLPGKNLEDQNLTIAAVKRWLEANTDWLLILDNADVPALAREFIPPSAKGAVLLTTRAQALGDIAQRIEIEKMGQKEATLFLLRRAKIIAEEALVEAASEADQKKGEEISQEMDGLPLALDQAGAYIEETACGLSGYLDLYQTHRTKLLERRGGMASDHPESVATTWAISFEKIEGASPAAAELLRFCAFLHPDEISEELFTEGALEPASTLQLLAADLFELNAAIEEILKYSLLRRDPSAKTLNIHRLVQAVLKDEMEDRVQRWWAECVVRTVNHALPNVEFQTWVRYEKLFSQIQVSHTLIKAWDLEFPEAARLLDQAGEYLRERARFGEAESLCQRSLSIREKVFGFQHPDVATSFNHLARIFYSQGKYIEAEPLYLRAQEIQEKVLRADHPDVAMSLNDLAVLYKAQGKYIEAESLQLRAQEIREKVLEADHPDVALGLNNLAVLYKVQGKYAEAEPLYLRAREIREQVLGAGHPDVAKSLGNLAGLYQAQGKYTEAEPLYLRSREILEQTLGADHPDVAKSLNNLAEIYKVQGKYAEAEPLHLRAREIREQVLGADHPDVAKSLNNLAEIYKVQGKYSQAETFYKRALVIGQKTLGPDHPDIAAILNNYALTLRKAKKKGKAAKMSNRAKAIRAKNSQTNR